MTTKSLLQKILKYYEVEDIEQLSKVLDVNSNILNDVIHDNNLSKFISILSEKDTDIVNDILDSSNAVQSINSLSGGNNTQTNFGAMYFNNYIIQNNNISQKIDNTSTDIYLLGLINYSKKFKTITTFLYYFIIPGIVILLFYFESILCKQISLSALSLVVLYFYFYYNHYIKANITDNCIKVGNKIINFSEIRKMEFNETKYINSVKIYGKNEIYPSKILYSDKDTISVISEYYSYYVNKNSKKIYQE